MANVEKIAEQGNVVDRPFSIEFRPGVTFPEWNAVSSENARRALDAILEAFGAEDCWDDPSNFA
ncbi:MAG: hypothetical protein IIA27_15165 [Gemmatimonadetes bacterium]|nr:hypothetical protein [Gemmatimonadota bacterium]